MSNSTSPASQTLTPTPTTGGHAESNFPSVKERPRKGRVSCYFRMYFLGNTRDCADDIPITLAPNASNKVEFDGWRALRSYTSRGQQ